MRNTKMHDTLKKVLLPLVIFAAAVLLLDIGCPIRRLTGFPCPGCGMTRAFLAAFRLDFAEAFRLHPLWMLPIPLFVLSLLRPGIFARHKWAENFFWGAMLVLTVGVYLVRMLLFFPHTPPMDYDTDALLYRLWQWISGFLVV